MTGTNAVNVLDGLKATKNLPKILQRAQTTVYWSYILLHDNHCEDPEIAARAPQVLSQIQKHFGSKDSCSLVKVNSVPFSSPALSREVTTNCGRSRFALMRWFAPNRICGLSAKKVP